LLGKLLLLDGHHDEPLDAEHGVAMSSPTTSSFTIWSFEAGQRRRGLPRRERLTSRRMQERDESLRCAVL
jgi:hypothetical protein